MLHVLFIFQTPFFFGFGEKSQERYTVSGGKQGYANHSVSTLQYDEHRYLVMVCSTILSSSATNFSIGFLSTLKATRNHPMLQFSRALAGDHIPLSSFPTRIIIICIPTLCAIGVISFHHSLFHQSFLFMTSSKKFILVFSLPVFLYTLRLRLDYSFLILRKSIQEHNATVLTQILKSK